MSIEPENVESWMARFDDEVLNDIVDHTSSSQKASKMSSASDKVKIIKDVTSKVELTEAESSAVFKLHKLQIKTSSPSSSSTTKTATTSNVITSNSYCCDCITRNQKLVKEEADNATTKRLTDEEQYKFAMGGQNILLESKVSD